MNLKLLLIAVLISASVFGQNVPSYVPANGLVGWWPFSGNADDISGNGNNGTVHGAILTSDRFGNPNSAYSFDGINDSIRTQYPGVLGGTSRTISFWAKTFSPNQSVTVHYGNVITTNSTYPCDRFYTGFNHGAPGPSVGAADGEITYLANSSVIDGTWHFYVYRLEIIPGPFYVTSLLNVDVFQDGIKLTSSNYTNNIFACIYTSQGTPLTFGGVSSQSTNPNLFFHGILDDIGMWNRALSDQEITGLFTGCAGNSISSDGPTTICAGNNVKLSSSAVGATYQWIRNGVNITGATSRRYIATQGGSYSCVAICNGIPITSNTIQVTWLENKSVVLSAAGNTAFCVGGSVTLNVTNPGTNYSIQWYRTNISLPGQTGTSLVVTQPGTYKVVTRNNLNGCSRISSSGITTTSNCRMADREVSEGASEDEELSSARVLDNENSQGVKIYPNPNQGRFRFEYRGHESGPATVQVINSMGQQLHEQRVEVIDGVLETDIQLNEQFTSGIYIVRMVLNGGMHDSRVVVE